MKFLVILIILLQQHECCLALDGPDQRPTVDSHHPPLGTVSSSDSAAASEADNAVSPTQGSTAPAGATAQAAPTAAGSLPLPAPDADTVCTTPTLGDWVLRRSSDRVCPLHPDDDSGIATLEEAPATAPAVGPAPNASEVQPGVSRTPPPEAVAEEADDEERQNFAAAKDGAKIVAANKEAKKAASLLDDDGDTFVKNECKADKWVVLELSQMVKVDTLKVSILGTFVPMVTFNPDAKNYSMRPWL